MNPVSTARHARLLALRRTLVALAPAVTLAMLLGACAPKALDTPPSSGLRPLPPASAVTTSPDAGQDRSLPAGEYLKRPARAGSPAATPAPAEVFDAARAHREMRALAAIGPRPAGSAAETRAARHLAARLRSIGLDPRIVAVPIPNGKTSHNVVATIKGTSSATLVLGAHYDTKSPSPGANDNASGCGVVLETARLLVARPPTPTVVVTFFGAEEMIDANPDHHHYGSRSYAARMSPGQMRRTAGVLVVDMIGVGNDLVVRTMGRGTLGLAKHVIAEARAHRVRTRYLRDPSAHGWSDHEPFERRGLPVAWLERREDPRYHTAGDTAAHVSEGTVRQAGVATLATIRGMDDARLSRLLTGR